MTISVTLRQGWIAIAVVIAAMTGYYWGLGTPASMITQQALLKFETDKPLALDPRIKTGNCIASNGLPDHQCTPGAVFPNVTKDQTCVAGYTKTVRSVSVSLKKQIYRQYNIPYPPIFGSYEADHFIPLTLGGNNDIANLFPEAAEPAPGFREKDLVENYLHEKVCAGDITLSAAQQAIAANWVDVYERISPAELDQLRQQYRSWSQTGD